ncbi:MAG: M55 family metallopeptidase [Candidatus Brockarchaeota archaeon]|nr:M55 family metallopeptidase [Candidatus Brockarchaeota archaeon]
MGKLKVWIMTDLEGVAGVFSFEGHASSKGRWYDLSRRLLTQEVNAAIEGALEVGGSDVLVVDGHGEGGINAEELNPEARLLSGRPLLLPWGLEKGFDAAFIIGQHAMAGVEKAHLSHTESHVSVQNVWINGKKVGELGMIAAIAGYFGVPLVLATGDRAACIEALSIVPGIETAAVKEGLSHGAAVSISPARSRSLIKEKARAALLKKDEIKPYKVRPPVELTVEYTEAYKASAEHLASKPWAEKVDARTVRIRDEDLLEAFGKWF